MLKRVLLLLSFSLIYFFLLPFKIACLYIVSVFVHEIGHWVYINSLNIRSYGIYFIPFKGAYIEYDAPIFHYEQYKISEGGPSFGIINATIYCAIYLITHNLFWAIMSSLIIINTIENLLPFPSADGNDMLKAIISPFNKAYDYFVPLTKYQSLKLLINYLNKFGISLFLLYIMKDIWKLSIFQQYFLNSPCVNCMKFIVSIIHKSHIM